MSVVRDRLAVSADVELLSDRWTWICPYSYWTIEYERESSIYLCSWNLYPWLKMNLFQVMFRMFFENLFSVVFFKYLFYIYFKLFVVTCIIAFSRLLIEITCMFFFGVHNLQIICWIYYLSFKLPFTHYCTVFILVRDSRIIR